MGGKLMFGCIGKLSIRVLDRRLARALVFGQFCGVGEKLNFGLGRYVIRASGIKGIAAVGPTRVRRSLGLIDLARTAKCIPDEANKQKVEMAAIETAFQAIQEGTYHPAPFRRFLLADESCPRLITIPNPLDLVLQKAAVGILAPVVDRFLSNSCIAYRKGLGRTNAISRLQHAVKLGYRWGLRTDFHRFFDSIDHALLRDKLEAFVGDFEMVNLIMQWVDSSSPQQGRGLATGSPLSPLLSNLFLESFDREVQSLGGYLTRYGDDLAILYRSRDECVSALEHAQRSAAKLKLHLNESKTSTIDLEHGSFQFLGYRFHTIRGWHFDGNSIAEVDELGWTQVPKSAKPFSSAKIAGEMGIENSFQRQFILGPDIDWLGIEQSDLLGRSLRNGTEVRVPLRKVRTLVILGQPTLDRSLLQYGARHPVDLILGDSIGRWTVGFFGETPTEDPGLVISQVHLLSDMVGRLHLSRQLVSSKLNNYAALARTYPGIDRQCKLASQLDQLSQQSLQAIDLDQLRGFEGSGAALWYGQLQTRLGKGFEFQQRVYPFAADPVNVLLNLTHSIMHRLFMLLLIRNGFAPSIGVFHTATQGHASLASDLQEIYRHLMDRVVIEATHTMTPAAFTVVENGDYPLRLDSSAYRAVVASVFRTLSIESRLVGASDPRSYLSSMRADVHNLRRHLANRSNPFRPFRHF